MTKVTVILGALAAVVSAACISSGDHSTVNNALQAGGSGAVVQLCENVLLRITDQILFTADDQEISTQNYPTGSTRATIQIAPGSSINTLIAGKFNRIKIKNIQLDGNRANTGFQQEGGASIEIGGQSVGQVVSNVASRNPRGWSCLHVIGSGNDAIPCKQASIIDNDIGPCGQSGRNDQGQGLWADGISFDCTDSLVEGNTVRAIFRKQSNHGTDLAQIRGPTDGGIVIFGSPGTTVNNNTIISSNDYLGFGAINMVDGEYKGSYSGVKVTNNRIQGKKIFNLGIGIGANVWSFNDPYPLQGPVEITGNKFIGQIVFPIAINGWTGGITVSIDAGEPKREKKCTRTDPCSRLPETKHLASQIPSPASPMHRTAWIQSSKYSTRTPTLSTTLPVLPVPRTCNQSLSLPTPT